MKPAAFEYHPADSVATALTLIAELGIDGKLLAGGQSLVPAMNFRLARPAHLIDLNPVRDLAYIVADGSTLRVGAMTRQRDVELSRAVATGWPLLWSAIRYIGHVQIRNRGTIGGSLAHADPAAELPAALVALDASLLLRRRSGERRVKAADFFVHYMTTVLEPDEMITEVRIPRRAEGIGHSFLEISRRHGDFALVGLATVVEVDGAHRVTDATLVFSGVGPTPKRFSADTTRGSVGDVTMFAAVARDAARTLEPDADIHADSEHRRELAQHLAVRGLAEAYDDAVAMRERKSAP
jgi:CO/xanthine dehydrogenase FAD-binding subunit